MVTAPTGSGKSTQVPRWCLDASDRQVVVVEPRRVACKTLAARVAHLEGCELGTRIGYAVRDDSMLAADTRLVFMTPGIALRRLSEIVKHSDLVVVDELHERGLDIDLIVALLHQRLTRGRLVVMSATLDAERVATYLGGEHVCAEGRAFPVDIEHVPGDVLLPNIKHLDRRIAAALERATEVPGDILVFLPGKGEIAEQQSRLHGVDAEVIALHGGLSLEAQSHAFAPADRRKIILATNVAETSVTVPGIGVVIDSGLVRRTRYHRGRGFLTLLPVAADSADQRAGRAGRTGPGVCFRLWGEAAKLSPSTPPEIHRESLLSLVLAAAACEARVEHLSFLDEPPDYAVDAALKEARALGALDEEGAITEAGRDLFGLPLDAPLGRLLVEARARGTLEDAIDLVSVLAVGRPLFSGAPSPLDEEGLRASGCDVTAAIRAVREGRPKRDDLHGFTLAEAKRHRRRLRDVFGVRGPGRGALDREALVMTALTADPRCAHVPRERRGRVTWSNGGTEIELGRESAANVAERRDALVVLETRAIGTGPRKTRIIATCAAPAELSWLVAAGLGRERVARVKRTRESIVCVVERVFARKVIHRRETVPEGALARAALAKLILDGELFPGVLDQINPRLDDLRLAARLVDLGLVQDAAKAPPPTPDWIAARLEALGVETVTDVELLSPADVVPDALPHELATVLAHELPRTVSTADARYAVEIDLAAEEVTLRYKDGKRGVEPNRSTLPSFLGLAVRVDTGRGLVSLGRGGVRRTRRGDR